MTCLGVERVGLVSVLSGLHTDDSLFLCDEFSLSSLCSQCKMFEFSDFFIGGLPYACQIIAMGKQSRVLTGTWFQLYRIGCCYVPGRDHFG